MPQEWKKDLKASPWLKMFQNARKWCEGNSSDASFGIKLWSWAKTSFARAS